MTNEKVKRKKLKIATFGHIWILSRDDEIEIIVEEFATRMIEHGYQAICYNWTQHHVSGKDSDDSVSSEYKGVRFKSVYLIDKKFFLQFWKLHSEDVMWFISPQRKCAQWFSCLISSVKEVSQWFMNSRYNFSK